MEQVIENKALLTFIVISVMLLLKYATVKGLKYYAKKKNSDKRHVLTLLRTIFNLGILLMVFSIWSQELQKFALSIAAFLAAIIIATREFILCLIGFVYALSTRPFRVGDWIQVGNYYGEVSAMDWAKVSILEINKYDYQFTGKTLYVPNSQLITTAVKNLNFLKRYAVHHFMVTRDSSVDPFEFIDELMSRAKHYCEDFIDVATRYNSLIESRLEIQIAGPDPHIQIATSELGDTQIVFTVFCPTEKAMEIEQKLTSDVFALWFSHQSKSSKNREKPKQ